MIRTAFNQISCRNPALLLASIVTILTAGIESQSSLASERPFRRVLVLQGAGMVPCLPIGIYDAACDAGKKPDLIIATCGSALSAASIGAYPDRAERNAFLASPDHHSMYTSATVRRPSGCSVLCRLIKTRCHVKCVCFRDTSVFDRPIMEVPLRPKGSHHIHRPFPTAEGEPRIIILGAEIDYCPSCEPRHKGHGKFFTETYFTDADTAQYLWNRTSAVAAQFPDSNVKPMTQVKLGHTLGDAARASISDPYYINLTHIDGKYFATGAVNLHPVELAQSLADEVIIAFYYPRSDPLGQSAWGTFFGYDIQERAKHVNQHCATHWIDFSDYNRQKSEFIFDPTVALSCSVVGKGKCCLFPLRMVTGVPASLCEFREKLDLQWCYGYERTIEALRQPIGSKAHIRIPNCCTLLKTEIQSPKLRIR